MPGALPEFKYDIDTPALVLDLDVMESNIKKMADYFKTVNADLRPHFKTPKTPVIAQMQIDAGAIGITCQKIGEAEVLAQAGVKGILIANQVAGRQKLRRLANLSTYADITVGIDDLQNAQDIAAAALEARTTVKVAIEIERGRCGVEPGKPTLEFAQHLMGIRGIKFMGIWCHQGAIVPLIKSREERKETYDRLIEPVIETKRLLLKSGIPVEICSAGYTAVYDLVTQYPEVTDVQAGSYVFMDWPYRQLEGLEVFEIALTVLTTVISRPPQKSRAYTDCGIKSIAPEHTAQYTNLVFPKVKNGELGESLSVVGLSEEHAALEGDIGKVRIGDKIELVPAHCCTTVNLHDRYYCTRGDRVVAIWPILARGRAD